MMNELERMFMWIDTTRMSILDWSSSRIYTRFITPLDFDDLCAAHEEAHGGTILPSSESKTSKITLERMRNVQNTYEFKPFMRQMNEFNFWLCSVRASHISMITIHFDFLDLPVFWPLLVLYFVVLFATTMRQQFQNMIKYKYIPFNFGKKTYSAFAKQAARMSSTGNIITPMH
ncbi:Rer1 family protein [Babesia gibsoni]|uniref:Rer1 family protein n=1 Tax=Babesia gibsoni TaxID=33632 RepID=A0AAD8PFK7_BABGI|nr:Rer1 family protein [Babesia gibsoni]